ncbi:MAG: hypothetical protein Q9218_006611 [Villophora microphyllina]
MLARPSYNLWITAKASALRVAAAHTKRLEAQCNKHPNLQRLISALILCTWLIMVVATRILYQLFRVSTNTCTVIITFISDRLKKIIATRTFKHTLLVTTILAVSVGFFYFYAPQQSYEIASSIGLYIRYGWKAIIHGYCKAKSFKYAVITIYSGAKAWLDDTGNEIYEVYAGLCWICRLASRTFESVGAVLYFFCYWLPFNTYVAVIFTYNIMYEVAVYITACDPANVVTAASVTALTVSSIWLRFASHYSPWKPTTFSAHARSETTHH